jgi:hypothetical protein
MLDSFFVQKEKPSGSHGLSPLESARKETLDWLNSLVLSPDIERPDWGEALKFFPPDPEKDEGETGFKIRLAFHLCTKENRYLITIIGSLDPADEAKFIICAHVNWKTQELKMKKMLEEAYSGYFDNDILTGSHVLWIQMVKPGEFHEALNSCATGILGHELVSHPAQIDQTVVKRPLTTRDIIDSSESSAEKLDSD